MTAANLLARSRGPLWNPTFSFPIKTFNTKKTFVDVRCAQQQRWIDCRASTILAIHFDARAWSAMRLHRAGCHESYVSNEKWFIGRHIAKMPHENSRVFLLLYIACAYSHTNPVFVRKLKRPVRTHFFVTNGACRCMPCAICVIRSSRSRK